VTRRRVSLPLRGAGGEPVDLWRTIVSHGIASLPPARIDEETRVLEITLPLDGRPPRMVRIQRGRPGRAMVEPVGRPLAEKDVEPLDRVVRHVLGLDEDLSEFYAVAARDPDLAWAAAGAGRMLRSPTVFEDVVKTVCTTNCSWALTEKMVSALVEHLGRPAAGAPKDGAYGRTFPSPAAMADADESFYRDVVRAGYRGPYLRSLAASVAAGAVDLEVLLHDRELPDEEVAARLLALPGLGPYAAAHVMMLIGRYSRLILDSWTRPTFARLSGRTEAADRTIERRFRSFGPYAGLAFWLFLTRGWVTDEVPLSGE
jgi:3-methyladenine DNA glycosylase/8-oxoguanine DNA glycosylase